MDVWAGVVKWEAIFQPEKEAKNFLDPLSGQSLSFPFTLLLSLFMTVVANYSPGPNLTPWTWHLYVSKVLWEHDYTHACTYFL